MRLIRSSHLLLVATLAACFPNDAAEPTGPSVSLEQQQWASSLSINLSAMTKLPSGIYFLDQSVGSGATLSGTPSVRVYYNGFLANGTKFDGNVGAGSPVSFPLANLIQGWQIGMQGMKVGGKRRLLLPSQYGYGPQGSPPVIPGNANLVFDIELVGIS